MKLSSALILFFSTALPLAAQPTIPEQDEITILLDLIESSKKNLQSQQKLLKVMIDFKKAREAFMNDPTSARLATDLVRSATRVKDEIEINHMVYLFSEDFLKEIQFFVNIGIQHKNGLANSSVS